MRCRTQLQDAIGTVAPYDVVNNPPPKVPPGLQPKIDLLLGWVSGHA
ncbi:hypothetical protein [Microbispora rosea]|nr:hypothetical protein [Microbispora rosea]